MTSLFNLLLCVLGATILLSVTMASTSDYNIIWNVPTKKCVSKLGVSLPVEQYGIEVNADHEFQGEKIVVLYEKKFGVYPRYADHSDPKSAVNGGLPQAANLTAHIAKVKLDVAAAIPNASFDGLAIIDFEDWSPLYAANWNDREIYKRESIKLVNAATPGLDQKTVSYRADSQFNKAARQFFVQTIKTCKRMRPNAKWGFYGFPNCNYNAGAQGESTCRKVFKDLNDQQSFVMNESTGLFPSIYLYQEYLDNQNFLRVSALMEETDRFNTDAIKKPVNVFAKFEYDPYDKPGYFYKEKDLCATLKQARELGADGALLWSTTKDMDKTRCEGIERYLKDTLGPYVRNVKNVQKNCNNGVCTSTDKCDTP